MTAFAMWRPSLRRVLGTCVLIAVGCWSCRPALTVVEAPPPFNPSFDWIVAESVEEILAEQPRGSSPEAQAELDRLFEKLRRLPPAEGYVLAVEPLERGSEPRWTVRDAGLTLAGLYRLAGTGRGGCVSALLAMGPAGVGGRLAAEAQDRRPLRAPDDEPAPGGQEGQGGAGEQPGGEDPEGEEDEQGTGGGGEPGVETGDEGTESGTSDEDEAPPLDTEPEEPIIIDEYYGVRCGSLSTIQSLLQLGLLAEGDAVSDGELKPELVTSFDQYLSEDGMEPPKMLEAHQSHAPEGQQIELKQEDLNEGQGTKKQQMDALERAMERVEDGWDCIATVTWRNPPKNGKPQKSTNHAEKIKKISVEGGTVTIETLDTFEQGGLGGSDVPHPPKTNRWKMKPPLDYQGRRDISRLAINCYRIRPAAGSGGG